MNTDASNTAAIAAFESIGKKENKKRHKIALSNSAVVTVLPQETGLLSSILSSA